MSELLDELARAMAAPMPRSRALRLLSGALVATALPGALRPARALGARPSRALAPRVTTKESACPPPGYCPSSSVNCGVCPGRAPGSCYLAGCGGAGSTCCCLKDGAGKPSGALLCAPGYECRPQGDEPCVCTKPCGIGVCCKSDEYCANFQQKLCCKRGWRRCALTCCEPNEECRKVRVGTGSNDICTKRCPPNQAWCGKDKCCPPKWKCVREGRCERCWPEEEECEKKCCDKKTSRCCGKAGCCPKGRSCCVTGKTQRCCPAGQKCAIPILAGDIGIKPGTAAICCPPARYSTSPKLCCPSGQVALNTPGFRTPPPGISPYCCPPGQICGSGASKFCANLQSDSQNCGRCGNVCASGICNGGICALP